MPHYRKAPITEAIINLQTRLPDQVTADALGQVRDGQEEQFPVAIELKKAQFEFRLGDEQHPLGGVQQPAGWVFKSLDEKRVVQSRFDGFAFGRLAPYDRWETLREEALSFWNNYRRIAIPEAVTAISLKYVNKFDIPLPLRDFKDFFRTVPEVSPAMPQGLAGFFMQLQIPYSDLGAMLVLTQTLVPPPQAGLVSVILDIDINCANNVPSEDEAIWQLLDQLRVSKNEIFEACITDAARELIR